MTPIATVPGTGNLPRLLVEAPDGARAELYLHGAHVTSWTPAGGREQLFLSPRSDFGAGLAIRGGVPIVFPQFGGDGPLPKHGFARTSPWELVSAAPGRACLRLCDTEATRALWPSPFQLDLAVTVGGAALQLALHVTNTGRAPLRFQAALHTYLAVEDVGAVAVSGLQGVRFKERAGGRGTLATQEDPEIRFTEELDRTYFGAPPELALREAGRTLRIRSNGFPDTVVWNPGAALAARIPDLGPGEHQRFVCVEAAAVAEPITLAPHGRWSGGQGLVAGSG
jgi:glucose-6-phosphate 1-epimerase